MNTDLDTKLTAALNDAASTTSVSDDAFSNIVRRADTQPKHSRSRRAVTTAAIVLAVAAGAGAAWAVVVDRLSSDQADIIQPMAATCGIETERAELVASFTGFRRTVDYWTVDSDNSFGDFLFDRGGTTGGGGCGAMSRAAGHPSLPWVQFLFSPAGNGVDLYSFYGQAPADSAHVEIVTSTGSVRASVADNGYFVVLAELSSDRPNELERIDAYNEDGTLTGTAVTD